MTQGYQLSAYGVQVAPLPWKSHHEQVAGENHNWKNCKFILLLWKPISHVWWKECDLQIQFTDFLGVDGPVSLTGQCSASNWFNMDIHGSSTLKPESTASRNPVRSGSTHPIYPRILWEAPCLYDCHSIERYRNTWMYVPFGFWNPYILKSIIWIFMCFMFPWWLFWVSGWIVYLLDTGVCMSATLDCWRLMIMALGFRC